MLFVEGASRKYGVGVLVAPFVFFSEGWFVGNVIVYSYVSVVDGSYCVFREPCGSPSDLKGNVEDGDVLIFRVYAGELFWYEAIVDVLAEVLCDEVLCFQLADVIYCLM